MTSKRVTVLGFDPGGTTGFAKFKGIKSSAGTWLAYDFDCGYLGPAKHHEALDMLVKTEFSTTDELHLITESFEFRNEHRDNVELISRNYIGILELIAVQIKPYVFHQQTAYLGKVVDRKTPGFVTPIALKKLGLWRTPKTTWKHSMDAYGHVLYYMLFNQEHKFEFAHVNSELLHRGWH